MPPCSGCRAPDEKHESRRVLKDLSGTRIEHAQVATGYGPVSGLPGPRLVAIERAVPDVAARAGVLCILARAYTADHARIFLLESGDCSCEAMQEFMRNAMRRFARKVCTGRCKFRRGRERVRQGALNRLRGACRLVLMWSLRVCRQEQGAVAHFDLLIRRRRAGESPSPNPAQQSHISNLCVNRRARKRLSRAARRLPACPRVRKRLIKPRPSPRAASPHRACALRARPGVQLGSIQRAGMSFSPFPWQ